MLGPKTQLITPIVPVVVQIGLTRPLTDFPSNWKLTVGAFSSLHIRYTSGTILATPFFSDAQMKNPQLMSNLDQVFCSTINHSSFLMRSRDKKKAKKSKDQNSVKLFPTAVFHTMTR